MLKNEAGEPITLEGQPKQGLAKLIGHQVKVDLMPALGVGDWMPECHLLGFDSVSIEVKNYSHNEFIPLMRVLSIRHAQDCRTESGDYCEGIDATA